MTDDAISERDGPTLEEMAREVRDWRDKHDRIAPPVLRAVYDMTPIVPTRGGPPTKRELEVLAVYVETCSYKETASRLGVAVSSTKSSMLRLLRRTDTIGVTQAAYRLGRGDWTREARA